MLKCFFDEVSGVGIFVVKMLNKGIEVGLLPNFVNGGANFGWISCSESNLGTNLPILVAK